MRWGPLEALWRDAQFALRILRSNVWFTVAAVLPLALAIACAGAVLTLADAVLFRATGVKDPGRVAAIYTVSRAQGRYLSDSLPDFRDIGSLPVVESAAAYVRMPLNVRLGEFPEQMNGEIVTGDYFRAAGVVPALGRALSPEDDRPGAVPVALASYSLWESRYRRGSSILGSTVWIDGVAFTIVGVMPEGYRGALLDWYSDPAFWLPVRQLPQMIPSFRKLDFENRRELQMFMMVARLRPGATLARLQAELDGIAPRVAASPDLRFTALPLAEARFFPAYRAATLRFLWILIGVTGLAVAVACFNLATLSLARAESRRREMETRRAVGASAARLFQQSAVENVVLAACACALALPVALGAAAWLKGVQITRGFQLSLDLSPDPRALGIAMLAGLAAALCGTSFSLSSFRRPRSNARRRPSWRDALVAAQVACALTVLIASALLAQSMHNLNAAPLGFEPRGVLLASLDLLSANVPRDRAASVIRALLSEVRTEAPEAAITTDVVIPTTMRTTLDVLTDSDAAKWRALASSHVSDGYFELLRMPVLSGRAISPGDDTSSRPVAVLNESAARLLWPNQNPLGRTLRVRGEPADREVVGIVRDARYRPLGEAEAVTPCLFLPLLQRYGTIGGITLHIRPGGAPLAFVPTLRQIVARVVTEAPVYGVETMQEHVENGLRQIRTAAEATAAVSLLSLFLALAGIFAASAYRVAQRRKEIAVRIAVGARPSRVIGAFALRGLFIGAVGSAAGAAPAIWGAILLRASIQGVGAASVAAVVLAAIALSCAAALAAWAAAARISRIQPADVLRAQ
ncbi:MAG TPA: ABC transporter permease [Bryobacteraceae bacterium]|jgi:predicted permease